MFRYEQPPWMKLGFVFRKDGRKGTMAIRVEDKWKRDRLQSATQVLIDSGVDFVVYNDGLHLVVRSLKDEVVDFWPSTGRWISRAGEGGTGVYPLLTHLGVVKEQGPPLLEEEPERVLCPHCNGSGEGLWDGSSCRRCGGRGEVEV